PDLEAVARRVVARALPQLADLLHPVVGGPVDLLHVERRPRRDLEARGALAAGIGCRALSLAAVEGLGQDAGGRCLAHSPGPGEEERMADAAGAKSVLQGAHRSGLSHDLVEGLGPPFPRENQVGHWGSGVRVGPTWAPATLRHTRGTPNRCSLPGLAGFGD